MSLLAESEWASCFHSLTRVLDLSPEFVSGSAYQARHVDSKWESVSAGFECGPVCEGRPICLGVIRIQFVEREAMLRGYLSNKGASANRRYRSALGVDLEFGRAIYDRACPSAAVAELFC